jgi:AcrR family transcriptional regulator
MPEAPSAPTAPITRSTPAARRARPLPPGARRAALIAATLPLIRRYGIDVSTRQIATAAGVAEGTIFRVFPDKGSLIQAAIDAAFDPAPIVAALARIDPAAPLATRLTAAVRIVQARVTAIINLMMALRVSRPLAPEPSLKRPRPSRAVNAAIVRLIGPDRGELRVPPSEAARLLRLLVFSGSHPGVAEGKLLTPEEIVTVILEGIRRRPSPPAKDHAPC